MAQYSQLSPRRTPLGPALSVRLREMSVFERVDCIVPLYIKYSKTLKNPKMLCL